MCVWFFSLVRAVLAGWEGRLPVCVWFSSPVPAVLAGSGGPASRVCVVLLTRPGGPCRIGRASLRCVCGSSRPSARPWLGRAGPPSGAFWCASPFLVLFGFLSAPSGLRVPFLLLFFSFFAPPFVSAFPLFPAPGAHGLGALWLTPCPLCVAFLHPQCPGFSIVSRPGCPGSRHFVAARPPRLFLFLLRSCCSVVPAPRCRRPWYRLVRFLFPSSSCGLSCGVCIVLWCCAPPPPPLAVALGAVRCPVFCYVVSGSGLACFLFFAVVFLSCAGVWLPCCLVCCPVVLFVLSLAVSRWCWPRRVSCCRAVPCCPVLFFAVFNRVWCRRAVLCVMVFSLMLCGVMLRFIVWSSGPLHRAALRWLCWSVMLCPLPPADALFVGLLLLPGPLS